MQKEFKEAKDRAEQSSAAALDAITQRVNDVCGGMKERRRQIAPPTG